MVLVDRANYSLNNIRIQEMTSNLYVLCWQFLFSILSNFFLLNDFYYCTK